MKEWAACAAAACTLALGAGWAMAGGIAGDPAAEAVRGFYAEMDGDGVKVRLEACAPLPRGSVYYLEDEYNGYPDWQAFRTVVYIFGHRRGKAAPLDDGCGGGRQRGVEGHPAWGGMTKRAGSSPFILSAGIRE